MNRDPAPEWRLLREDEDTPDGPPMEAGTTLYTFDARGCWVFDCPPLPAKDQA